MYDGGVTYVTDSLKFYPIILSKNIFIFWKPSTYRLGFLSNCTVASYNTDNRAEKCKELDFWRSNFWMDKCLNFCTVSPYEGVKEHMTQVIENCVV